MASIVARYQLGRFTPGTSGNPAGRPRGSGSLRRLHDELTGLGAIASEIVELAETAGRPAASAVVIAKIIARLSAERDSDATNAQAARSRKKSTPVSGA